MWIQEEQEYRIKGLTLCVTQHGIARSDTFHRTRTSSWVPLAVSSYSLPLPLPKKVWLQWLHSQNNRWFSKKCLYFCYSLCFQLFPIWVEKLVMVLTFLFPYIVSSKSRRMDDWIIYTQNSVDFIFSVFGIQCSFEHISLTCFEHEWISMKMEAITEDSGIHGQKAPKLCCWISQSWNCFIIGLFMWDIKFLIVFNTFVFVFYCNCKIVS